MGLRGNNMKPTWLQKLGKSSQMALRGASMGPKCRPDGGQDGEKLIKNANATNQM